jgi:hypothetical protein
MEFCPNGDLLQNIEEHRSKNTHYEEILIWKFISHIG